MGAWQHGLSPSEVSKMRGSYVWFDWFSIPQREILITSLWQCSQYLPSLMLVTFSWPWCRQFLTLTRAWIVTSFPGSQPDPGLATCCSFPL